jgi:peptide/nickel transport system permease protein
VTSTAEAPARPSARVLSSADEAWVLTPPAGLWRAKLWRIARAFRDPAVAIPAAILLAVVFLCYLGPFVFSLPSPNATLLGLHSDLLPPGSPGHLLGTDYLGRDQLSRILHGGQVSILVGIGATAVGMVFGTLLGMTAGFFGGILGTTILRFFDGLLAFPGLILALAIADFLGPSEWHTILAISAFGVATYGRLSRSQTLGVRHRDFVVAARSNGAKSSRIISRHVLPNVIPTLLVYAMITVGIAMLIEAALSYLGLGIRPPQASWGNLIAAGEPYLSSAPWLVWEPAAALFITVLSLNLLGDSLRRRLALDR